ncbi:hypothetical protein ALC60_01222, partial [Trachymyrmex zeteki]
NFSSMTFPGEVQCLLQLGENFCLSPHNVESITLEFIKHIEDNLTKLKINSNGFRNSFFPYIQNIKNITENRSDIDGMILDSFDVTKQFLKENPQVLLTRVNKSNVVVAMDKIDYIDKMEVLLLDTDTYTVVMRNPTNKILNDLKSLLQTWKKNEYVIDHTYNFLNSTNAIIPRVYGLPKIHKTGNFLPNIVSSIGSPSSPWHIQKPVFLNSLFDVVSLFTNVSVNLVIESIENRWSNIQNNIKLPKTEFVKAVSLVLNSMFFSFNNKIYKQSYGVPMGSPLSPLAADLVMQKLEKVSLNKLKFTPGDKLNFLDLTIKKEGNNLIYDWYHKLTFSARYLNFFSKIVISKSKLFNRTEAVSNRNRQNNKIKYFTISYVPSFSDKFHRYFKNNRFIRLAFTRINKLNSFIKEQKDRLSTMTRSNVVYKINCQNCDVSYVGQTKRLLKSRISEHRNHINRNTSQNIITEHRIEHNHDFDWDNVRILEEERSYNRLISEEIFINKQNTH